MVKIARVALVLLMASTARAETFRFFGSTAGEWQMARANQASPLNPGNLVGIERQTGSADLSAFFDVVPESRRFKFHFKLRGDSVERAGSHAEIGEAFAQLNLTPSIDIGVGRAIEKWGTGYAWNPTAFISPKKNPADPTDRRSAYRGLNMIKGDLFVHGTNVSMYALEHRTYAARVYRLIRGTDLSLHLRRDREHTNAGVSAARVFGNALELHGEIAQKHALAGGQYTFHDNVNVVLELYHGGDGLTETEWRAFCRDVDLASDALRNGNPLPLLRANGRYAPLRMARNYAFTRFYWPSANQKSEVELIAIGNLRDGSALARLTFSRKLRPALSAYLLQTEFLGARDSEFAYIQVRRLTTIGMRWYF